MPTGVYDRKKAAPRGSKVKPTKLTDYGMSENMHKLLEMQRELQERIDAAKRIDKARAQLLTFARHHALTGKDLREVAKLVDDRKVANEPVETKKRKPSLKNMKPAKGKLGKAIRQARIDLKMTDIDIGRRLGVGQSTVAGWQNGKSHPTTKAHQDGLVAILKIDPALFRAPSLNGASHAS